MSCTTVLVGKKASNDGSTMIARTDDGFFDVKKIVVIEPSKQPRKYRNVISHREIELPDDPITAQRMIEYLRERKLGVEEL